MEKVLEKHSLTLDKANAAQKARAVENVRDAYMGCLFIHNSDRLRYSGLAQELHNDFLKGNDDYPKNLTEADNKQQGISIWWLLLNSKATNHIF